MFGAFAPALVDYFYFIDRYPELGGHSTILSTHKFPGGAGANVAHNLATLGINSQLFTTLGNDDNAQFFIENTKAKVIAEITDDKTGITHVFVDKSGERTFFVEPNAASKPFVEVHDCGILYFDPFPSDISFDLQLRVAKESTSFRILNPGYPYVRLGFSKLKRILRHINAVILSYDEFKLLNVDARTLSSMVDYLVITKGERGSICYYKNKIFKSPGLKAEPTDTTGAGDAFAAGFIYGLISELPIEFCLAIGNFCGAYNVERVGARNFPSKDLIEDFLARILK